jgi:hypothetical protein
MSNMRSLSLIGYGQWGNHLGQLMLAVRLAELHNIPVIFYADHTYSRYLHTIFHHPQVELKTQRRFLRRIFTYITDVLPITPSDHILTAPQPGKVYCTYGHDQTLGWNHEQYKLKIRECFRNIDFDHKSPEIVFHYRSYLMRSYYSANHVSPTRVLELLEMLYNKYGLPIRFMSDLSTKWRKIEQPDEATFRQALALPFVRGDLGNSFYDDWLAANRAEILVTVAGSSFALIPMIMNANPVYLIGEMPSWEVYQLSDTRYIELGNMTAGLP